MSDLAMVKEYNVISQSSVIFAMMIFIAPLISYIVVEIDVAP